MHPSKSINFACSPRPPRPSHTCRSLFLCRPRLSSIHLRSSFAFSWSSQRLILFLLSFSYRLQHSLDSSTTFPAPSNSLFPRSSSPFVSFAFPFSRSPCRPQVDHGFVLIPRLLPRSLPHRMQADCGCDLIPLPLSIDSFYVPCPSIPRPLAVSRQSHRCPCSGC